MDLSASNDQVRRVGYHTENAVAKIGGLTSDVMGFYFEAQRNLYVLQSAISKCGDEHAQLTKTENAKIYVFRSLLRDRMEELRGKLRMIESDLEAVQNTMECIFDCLRCNTSLTLLAMDDDHDIDNKKLSLAARLVNIGPTDSHRVGTQ